MKRISKEEATSKAMRYCAYQERSPREVQQKLQELGQTPGVVSQILKRLTSEDFLNEKRFARLFAGGKFRLKKWGRIKIKTALRGKGLSPSAIELGIEEIPEEDYLDTLQELSLKWLENHLETAAFERSQKLAKYLIAKGFEAELVWKSVSRR